MRWCLAGGLSLVGVRGWLCSLFHFADLEPLGALAATMRSNFSFSTECSSAFSSCLLGCERLRLRRLGGERSVRRATGLGLRPLRPAGLRLLLEVRTFFSMVTNPQTTEYLDHFSRSPDQCQYSAFTCKHVPPRSAAAHGRKRAW